jgi:hypothetical protein
MWDYDFITQGIPNKLGPQFIWTPNLFFTGIPPMQTIADQMFPSPPLPFLPPYQLAAGTLCKG